MNDVLKIVRDKLASEKAGSDLEAGNRYNEDFRYLDFHAARFKYLFSLGQKYFSPGARFLDIGSLFGYLALGYQEIGYQVCGLDLEKYVVDLAPRFQSAGIDNRACDLSYEPIPFNNEEFDLIIASEVLEHFRFHPISFFKEAVRVLKPGGRLIITTPNLIRLNNVIKMILGHSLNWDIADEYWDGAHAREFTAAEIKIMAEKSGLKVDKIEYRNIFYPNMSYFVRFLDAVTGLLWPRRRSNLIIILKK